MVRNATKLLWKVYRLMLCNLDTWLPLSMEEMRLLEEQCARYRDIDSILYSLQ